MYISKLKLTQSQKDIIKSPYELHRRLSLAFSRDKECYKNTRILFLTVPKSHEILCSSKLEPDWKCLPGLESYDCQEVDPCFKKGEIRPFFLKANPTIKHGGKRRGLTKDKLDTWINRKAQENGFILKDYKILNYEFIRISSTIPAIATVYIQGYLEVSETKLFEQAVCSGIGSAKGFGYGLLYVQK